MGSCVALKILPIKRAAGFMLDHPISHWATQLHIWVAQQAQCQDTPPTSIINSTPPVKFHYPHTIF